MFTSFLSIDYHMNLICISQVRVHALQTWNRRHESHTSGTENKFNNACLYTSFKHSYSRSQMVKQCTSGGSSRFSNNATGRTSCNNRQTTTTTINPSATTTAANPDSTTTAHIVTATNRYYNSFLILLLAANLKGPGENCQ